MTLEEMKKKYLSLIEEVNPNSEHLTDDPDLAAKQNEVVNQVMFELARVKKLPKYAEKVVSAGELITLADIGNEIGSEVYQIQKVSGVKHAYKASGTVIKFLESGTAEFDLFVYPERITEKTKDKAYEFELSQDALEIMPYGIAADLLKSDVSTEYGSIYATRYESMKQQLDPRYHLTSIYIEGGVSV
jgi:hypothetical protein